MAGAAIELGIEGLERIQDLLQQMIARGRDLRVPFADIGEHLQLAHDDLFAAQKSPEGVPWAPLNPKYQARKKKNPDKILILEGDLRDTLRYQAGRDQLEFGTDRIYGATHQFGAPERGIKDPRPFLGIPESEVDEIAQILSEWLLP